MAAAIKAVATAMGQAAMAMEMPENGPRNKGGCQRERWLRGECSKKGGCTGEGGL